MSEPRGVETTLSHYRIVSKIGAGGMGEVYLAQDIKLDRKVALKILPAEVASNRDRMERFIREAKSAAALSHPNIAQIFEIGEDNSTHFIAMEFIDGVTLREKIHTERTELRKLLRYLHHVAEGLAKAHAAGIVHRDLKPDNIMIARDGHAKILDFGLAKLIEQPPIPSGDSSEVATAMMPQHSTPGTVMGTVGYMSPEQAQGKTREIDQRSDVFSFGCILFEAATGRKPFEGDSIIKALHMVVYEPAPAITDINPTAPADLQRIVRRCLEKDADNRYQGIKEVAIELKHLRREMDTGVYLDTTVPPPVSTQSVLRTDSGSTAEPTAKSASLPPALSSAEFVAQGLKRHKLGVAIALVISVAAVALFSYYLRAGKSEAAIESIAVMPFVNESGNADVEYLSDGMTETLISSLSQLPTLNVKPRSSVFRYKGKETNPQTIGKELNVQAILNGRVVQRGQDLSLFVELIDVALEKVVWSRQYNRKQTDLVTLQSEIARDVSSKLKSQLSGADVAKVAYGTRTFAVTVLQPGQAGGATLGPTKTTYNDDIITGWVGVGSQFDGFGHAGIDNLYFNCNKAADFTMPDGLKKLGIENVPAVATRGVLLDMAGYFDTDIVKEGTAFNRAEIEGAMKRQGIKTKDDVRYEPTKII